MRRGVIQGSMVAAGLAGVAASVVLAVGCDERVLVGNLRPIDGVTGYAGSGLGGKGFGGAGGAPYTGLGGSFLPPSSSCPTITTTVYQVNPCGHASGLAYSPDGTMLAVANMDSSVVPMWRLSDGSLVRTFDGNAQTNYDLAFSPDGHTLVVVGAPGGSQGGPTAKMFDVASGALIRTLPTNSGFYTDTVAFSPDGSLIATSGYMGAIDLWRASDGSLVVSIPYPTSVHNVHFSPSGTQLIAGGVDQRATIWNVPSGTLAMTLNGIAPEMADATFSPDGKLIASTSSAGNGLRIWDAGTGALLQEMYHHAAYVSSVVWIDNDRIVTGSWDGIVVSYFLESPTEFGESDGWGTDGQVLGIAISPDHTRIVTGAGHAPEGFEFLPLRPLQ